MPGRRSSPQRDAIRSALSACDGAVSAQELHVRLDGTAGLATVYRTLQRLAEDGEADVLMRPTGETTFRLCGSGHHHHLTCRGCGHVEEVRECDLAPWVAAVARRHGFAEVEHSAELTGLCTRCAIAA